MKRLSMLTLATMAYLLGQRSPISRADDLSHVLVLDCSASKGQIAVVQEKDGKWSNAIIRTGVSNFLCSSAGHCIYTTKASQWMRGKIGTNLPDERLDLKLTGAEAGAPALSTDGRMLAFVDRRKGSDELQVVSVLDGAMKTVVARSDSTRILAPAWSPDGKTLAYYRKGGDRADVDPALIVQRVVPEIEPAKEVAPPSLPTRLSGPDRSRPKWSPDGKRILFEAHYAEDSRGSDCVVNADGTNLQVADSGIWASDSEHLLTVAQQQPPESNLKWVLAVMEHGSAGWTMQRLGVAIPQHAVFVEWEPSRAFVGIVAEDNTVSIINVKTGQSENVGRLEGRCTWAGWVTIQREVPATSQARP